VRRWRLPIRAGKSWNSSLSLVMAVAW